MRVLEQLQRTFCFMQFSKRRYFDPRPFVDACKTLNLNFNVYHQNDAAEFCDQLLDRIENATQGDCLLSITRLHNTHAIFVLFHRVHTFTIHTNLSQTYHKLSKIHTNNTCTPPISTPPIQLPTTPTRTSHPNIPFYQPSVPPFPSKENTPNRMYGPMYCKNIRLEGKICIKRFLKIVMHTKMTNVIVVIGKGRTEPRCHNSYLITYSLSILHYSVVTHTS